jgi:microcystin-dependent protein
MAEPFLSEIRLFGFGHVPKNWARCDGQLLPINQNQALFSLLGTTYGGDGRVNFALPDLRGRVPLNRTSQTGNGPHTLGERAGAQAHTLVSSEMPAHAHMLVANSTAADSQVPASNRRIARSAPGNLYGAPNNLVLANAGAVSNVGGSQAHQNMQPYLTITFGIALVGIFPSVN